jgi:hypothetical protein
MNAHQGSKVKLNVYLDDRPLCQAHSEEDAALIVKALCALDAQDKTDQLIKHPPWPESLK